MHRALLVLLVAVAGCDGPAGESPLVDAALDGPSESGLCADRPCRTSIDTAGDWASVSAPLTGRRCDLVEDTKYIAPAVPAAALQEIVFQDVKVHRLHLSFMTQVLTEYFGGLSPQMYQALVQRRATRQYWAGAIYRLTDVEGVTLGYGFDVIVDPSVWDEHLTETEVRAIETLLESRFHLPLVYAPTESEALYRAYSFTQVEVHRPRACQYVPCADPTNDCVQVPTDVALCGHFMEGRPIVDERAAKTRLLAVAGNYVLPRAPGVYTVPAIFGAGEHGPAHTPITPTSTSARYEVTDHGSFRTHRYTQEFTAGASSMELGWDVRLPETGGGLLVAEPYIGDHVWMMAAFDGGVTRDDLAELSSCTNETLEPWRITGTMPGGDGFVLDFRYLPPAAGSGPLFPERAEVTLGGAATVVADYFRLVYAGEHHNWNNQYWILFSPPVTYAGHDISGIWLDEHAYMAQLEAAWTLDAALQPLDRLDVTGYSVARTGL